MFPKLLKFVVSIFLSTFFFVTALPTVPVQLNYFNFTNNILSGEIYVQNIAYQKVVTIYYSSDNDTWNIAGNSISASYEQAISNANYEFWTFNASISSTGIQHFYIQYVVSGTSYYDNNGSKNYLVATTTTTTSAAASTKTTSTTTSITTSATTTASTTAPTTASTTFSVTTTTTSSTSGGSSSCTVPAPSKTTELVPCQTWSLDSCAGNQTNYPSAGYDERKWQTPARNGSDYVTTFQDYRELTGYADITYNADRTSAVVTIQAFSRTCQPILYSFGGGKASSSNTYTVTSTATGTLSVVVTIPSVNATLTLDPLYFIWDKQAVDVPATNNGQKVAIVELFGWPYNDVANECEFLGKAGWAGVRIWPAQEHMVSNYYYETDGQYNPWYFLYQPVSYRLTKNRMGTRDELRNMIQTCRKNGVRVYADAVINHMTGGGNDIQLHRNPSGGSCTYWTGHNTTSGSPMYTHDFTYTPNKQTGARPALEFPAVPYGPTDFHCERSLNSWSDPFDLNYGWLVGLTDLNTESDYVRNRIAAYLIDLLSIGFSGFRVDAAKHISPDNLAAIFGKVSQRLGGSLPDDFISWLEVLMGGEKDLLACQPSSYNYYTYLDQVLASNGISNTDIQKIKIWSSDYPKEFPVCGTWILPPTRFVIQNDDHDQQTSGSSSRDMGSQGSVLIVSKDVPTHRAFEVELFTRTDGNWTVRNVLSSYSFMNNGASGFPDGLSDCSTYVGTAPKSGCLSMSYTPAYVADACGYSVVQNGTWQQGTYTRVHRDLSIINAMRGWMGYPNITTSALGLPSTCT